MPLYEEHINRASHVADYYAGMFDLQLMHNPMSEEVILVFNTITRDHYQDAITTEDCRVRKTAMVKKTDHQIFVQETGGELREDTDELPWTITLTASGLPREPRMDDQVSIRGNLYTISSVAPINRAMSTILEITIYPERGCTHEDLEIVGHELLSPECAEIYYNGYPQYYSFNPESVDYPNLRRLFKPVVDLPEPFNDDHTIYVFESLNPEDHGTSYLIPFEP